MSNDNQTPKGDSLNENAAAAAAVGNGAAGSLTANAALATDATKASTLNVTSGVEQSPLTPSERVDATAQTVRDVVAALPAEDIGSEIDLLGAIKGYRQASITRFAKILNGMENSTAAALRALGEAELHLADHIAAIETANAKVEA